MEMEIAAVIDINIIYYLSQYIMLISIIDSISLLY